MLAGGGAPGRVTDRVACLHGHLLDGSRPCSRSVSPGFYRSPWLAWPGPLPSCARVPAGSASRTRISPGRSSAFSRRSARVSLCAAGSEAPSPPVSFGELLIFGSKKYRSSRDGKAGALLPAPRTLGAGLAVQPGAVLGTAPPASRPRGPEVSAGPSAVVTHEVLNPLSHPVGAAPCGGCMALGGQVTAWASRPHRFLVRPRHPLPCHHPLFPRQGLPLASLRPWKWMRAGVSECVLTPDYPGTPFSGVSSSGQSAAGHCEHKQPYQVGPPARAPPPARGHLLHCPSLPAGPPPLLASQAPGAL